MAEQSEGGYGGIDIEASRETYGHDQTDEFGTPKLHVCQHIRH